MPREHFDPQATGAHWDFPERQPELWPRERSIEHGALTPVFGTSCPPKLLSGLMRKFAYQQFSEARAAHWLLLVAADRVDALESHVIALAQGHPDPMFATGLRSELSHNGWSSRVGTKRVDLVHQVLDPAVVAGPALAFVGAVFNAAQAAARRVAAYQA